ncbi:MAG: ATP-binding protein [Pseudomonadota bacterium]
MRPRNIGQRSPLSSFDAFVRYQISLYLSRFIDRYPSALSPEVFEAVLWLVGPDEVEACLKRVAARFRDPLKRRLAAQIRCLPNETSRYEREVSEIISEIPRRDRPVAAEIISPALDRFGGRVRPAAACDLSMRLNQLGQVFSLTPLETEIVLFLFIVAECPQAESLFQHHLEAARYHNRGLLASILDAPDRELQQALSGKLTRIGIVEGYPRHYLTLEDGFVKVLQEPWGADLDTLFFKRITPDAVPLNYHVTEPAVTRHALDLLRNKPDSATHILLYGPPGTGKTSFAQGLGTELGLEIYEVNHGHGRFSTSVTASVAGTVHMARNAPNALVIVDDAEAALNTPDPFSHHDASSHRRWLHEILETSSVRMIWIVNSTEAIEHSTIRRFAFSVEFKPFTRDQRIRAWHSTLDRKGLLSLISEEAISTLATRHEVSPGVMEMAARKASEVASNSPEELESGIHLGIDAYKTLVGRKSSDKPTWSAGEDCLLPGLNVKPDNVPDLLKELEAFDRFQRTPGNSMRIGMSLLFHGYPGTGKSYLARYIAHHLDRPALIKRGSDIFSMWVGKTETNIRAAYEEAAREGAVLIFDEADSLIFNRENAVRSFEVSFTNEMLTWMESFEGIQIFTTNRVKDLDAAGLRRFNHKLDFGFLKPDGVVLFYHRYLGGLAADKMDDIGLERIKRLSNLTPGDFKAVRDRFFFKERDRITHSVLVDALIAESKMKAGHAGEKVLGFVA